MSILTTAAAISAAVLVAGYAIGQFTSKTIITEIEIAASASTVWAELTDTSAFADWNPLIKSLSGDLSEGNRINVTIELPGKSPMDFTPTVLVSKKNRELRWVGHLGIRGIFDGEHYFVMEETAHGTTLFRHGKSFSGMLTHILLPLIGNDTKSGFDAMNKALKHRAELKV